MPVNYEWDVETINTATGDIENHDHRDRLKDVPYTKKQLMSSMYDLCLVRDKRDSITGDLVDRQWAYAREVNGKLYLPPYFNAGAVNKFSTSGQLVPVKYLKEFDKWSEEDD